jgi:hypothetical protein
MNGRLGSDRRQIGEIWAANECGFAAAANATLCRWASGPKDNAIRRLVARSFGDIKVAVRVIHFRLCNPLSGSRVVVM